MKRYPLLEAPGLRFYLEASDSSVRFVGEGLGKLAVELSRTINRFLENQKPVSLLDDKLVLSSWIPDIPSKAGERFARAQLSWLRGKNVPDQVSICVTHRCYCNCKHCSATTYPKEEMSQDEIISIIDQALELGSYLITFDGGEPTLRKDLPDLVASVGEDAITKTFTNGYKIKRDFLEKLRDSGLRWIDISLDSPYPDEHDEFRGLRGLFDEAMRAVERARELGIGTGIFYVARPGNCSREYLEELYRIARDHGIQEVSIYEIVAVGRWNDGPVLGEDDRRSIEEFSIEANSRPGIPRFTALTYLQSPKVVGCLAGKKWMHVTPGGEVQPCAYLPVSFGNATQESLEEIWRRMQECKILRNWRGTCLANDPWFRKRYWPRIIEHETPAPHDRVFGE